MSEQLHFCHTIEQHVDVQNRKPCNVSFFVSDCHFYLTCQRKKKICYGFWALYVSPRTKVSFSFFFCHHLCNCNLVSNETWNLEFWNLKISGLFIMISKKTYPLLATKLRLVSHIFFFMNIILTLRYLKTLVIRKVCCISVFIDIL